MHVDEYFLPFFLFGGGGGGWRRSKSRRRFYIQIHVCIHVHLLKYFYCVLIVDKTLILQNLESGLSNITLTLLWFYLSKPFKICLLAKWLSICLNLSKPSIIFCYCTTTPFKTLRKDLKGRKIGLWYVCSESCFTFQNLS